MSFFKEEDYVQVSEEEETYTYNDDSKYSATQLRQLLADNISDLDAMQRKFERTLSQPETTTSDMNGPGLNFRQTSKTDNQRQSLAD